LDYIAVVLKTLKLGKALPELFVLQN